ncbi:hypothetical protein GCM10027600_28840 [Nocardioides ginsengisegetis]
MMPEPEPDSWGPETSIFTTEGSTCWATCSTLSLLEDEGVSTTCELVGALDEDDVVPSAGCQEVQAAAPPTPAAPPTSRDAATTDAANAPRRGRFSVTVPVGGGAAGAGGPLGGKTGCA